ncbi:MAG TPA: Mur ligase domain-containing protein, partial [Thermoanaerobaculia bacterium]|nr:Mur ligase domain-containing protein [Thermoanaerobaculia bacterium]
MNFEHIKKIHFVGIGGIGMSGIAEILSESGVTVSGCDLR